MLIRRILPNSISSMKHQFSNFIRNSLILSTGYFLNSTIKMNINPQKYKKQYDLAVIGGGSGGLATAFQAAKYGLNVIVIDYVEETVHKTKWGLGGTCVNVGCIPKKLMHNAAKYGEEIVNANDYGWMLPNQVNDRINQQQIQSYFSWQKLRAKVQNHIKSLNFGYLAKINAQSQHLEYLNGLATFKDKNTLICSKQPQIIKQYTKTGQLPQNSPNTILYQQIKAKNFLIATGTRPQYLNIQGSNLAITSDDIFSLKNPPGKTLIIGGGYVAVEIAGFLRCLGYDTTIMTRGEYLRAFDRDMVNVIVKDLEMKKVKVVEMSLPKNIKRNSQNNKYEVVIQNQKTNELSEKEQFDTVLFAVGRYATTDVLNLQKVGVETTKSKKIKPSQKQVQRTSIDNIYAIGDVIQGLPQLTSTAVKMGQHLGRRLVSRIKNLPFKPHQTSISLQNYPTTIFTPLQYSCCGLSQQQAIKQYGRQRIINYHIKYKPLQQSLLQKYTEDGGDYKVKVYAKAVVDKQTDKVLGLHYAGPNAGEVMQGFAVAMRMGLTKTVLDSTIGIHPTIAEDLTNMTVTKQSGQEYEKTSC